MGDPCCARSIPRASTGEPGVGDHAVDFWSVAETSLAWLLDLEDRAMTPESILRRLHSTASAAAHCVLGLPGLVLGGGIGPGAVRRDPPRSACPRLASAVSPGAATRGRAARSEDCLRRRVAQVLAAERGDVADALGVAHELSALRAANARPLGPEPPHAGCQRPAGEYRRVAATRRSSTRPSRTTTRASCSTPSDTVSAVSPASSPRSLLKGFNPINDRDFREWLGRHGAHPVTLEHAPFIRGSTTLCSPTRRRHGQTQPRRRQGDPGADPDHLRLQGRADVPAQRRDERVRLPPALRVLEGGGCSSASCTA